MAPISQAKLALRWGMDKGQLCKMVKRGMPLTSEAEAEKWRSENQKIAGWAGGKLKKPTRLSPSPDPLRGEGEDSDWISPYARIKMAEETLRQSNEMLKAASREGNAVAMRAAVDAQINAQKSLIIAEEAKENHDLRNKKTILMSEVNEFSANWLGGIRNLMDAMPSSLAARANPSDPECAKRAIQEGIEQIFITITKAEGAFK